MSNPSSSFSSGGINPVNDEPPESFEAYGVPEYCWCDEEVVRLTSRTTDNPLQRFFRCRFVADAKLRNDKHIFKWVEDGYYEELKDIGKRLWRFENDVDVMRKSAAERIREEDKIEDHIMNQLDSMIAIMDYEMKKKMVEMEARWMKRMVQFYLIVVLVMPRIVTFFSAYTAMHKPSVSFF